ncbi:alpha/beta hydrolase [Dictyobacter vulcani]|uniref:Alpha/beta hydrolase n=1 Tax=Dictyobacter vulcani TaxID=2607529 RepID=A0A5J4KTV0_9CHLR|nr:PHB depolymerase family esterase [Dictyobacter vulcani]GER89901.1 alpha/beta hydrolase [Dictyobacter vulcani]
MGFQTFQEFTQQLGLLYDKEQKVARAFEVLQQEYQRFPEYADQTYYWRIFMASRLGQQTLALHLFEEALDRGYWFAPSTLETDEDLVSLHPLPAFQAMVEICRQRLIEAQTTTRPDLLVVPPEKQGGSLPLLMALHGNWSNARDTQEHWRNITTRGWLLGVPQSSQIIGQHSYVWDDRQKGTHEVCEHLTTLNKVHVIDPERVVVGGFSQGSGLAILLALHQSIKTCGFVVLAPHLSEVELETLPPLLDRQKPMGLRGSIIVGEEDTRLLGIAHKIAEVLRSYDLPCQLEIYPGLEHTYPSDFATCVTKGLAFIDGE